MLPKEDKIAVIVKYTSVVTLMLYFLQGVIYPTSFIIAKFSLAIYLAVGIFCMSEILMSRTRQHLIYVAVAFLVANLAYYGFTDTSIVSSFYNIDPQGPIKHTTFVFITLLLFFFLSKKDMLDKKLLLILYSFFFIIGIINFYSLSPFSPRHTNAINNSGYIFVNILPFIFLVKRKSISAILLIASSILAISSLKRGAMIILVAFVIYYVCILLKESKLSFIQKFSIVSFAAIICGAIALQIHGSNELIQERVTQTLSGNTSGRDVMYKQLWDNWTNSDSTTKMLFGYGYSYTPMVTYGRYAHNDWLELLTNMGLFGIGLYMLFFVGAIASAAKCETNSAEKRIIVSVIIVMIIKSAFSMGYDDQGTIPLMLLLGYVAGKNELKINSDRK